MPSHRHVLVPVATGIALRNVLRTDLPHELARRGLHPVYLVPDALHASLAGEDLGAPGSLDVLPDAPHRPLENALRDIAFAVVQRHHKIATIDIHERRRARNWPRMPRKERLAKLLGRSWTAYFAADRLRRAIYRFPEMQAPFDRWRPVAVFANNVFNVHEAGVLRRAQVCGVPAVGMVHSWDNPSNKGMLPAWPDHLLVWSEVMRDEMTGYFRYPERQTRIVGSPQFDIYARKLETTKADLLRDFDLPQNARLIVYASGAPGHCAWEPQYARVLADLVAEGDGRGPLALVVRLHPRDYLHRYEVLEGLPNVRLEVAGRGDQGMTDRWNPTEGDHLHFAALMRHADVAVNLASTVALDAAANDRPIVHVHWDVEPASEYLDSVDRLFDYTHTVRLMSCEASLVARNADEVRAHTLSCLAAPAARAAARRRLARQEGYDGEGRSAERIADVIASAVADAAR